jgi:hypothetical protein
MTEVFLWFSAWRPVLMPRYNSQRENCVGAKRITEQTGITMPRAYPHSHLCHGHLVGFSVKLFGNSPTYFACFNSKDGRRLKRDTNQTRMGQAVEAARAIIEKEYAPAAVQPDKVTWDQAIDRLKLRFATAGMRASTLDYYLKLIRLIRKMYSVTDGPADISPGMAASWRDTMMSTPGRRKKLPSGSPIFI